MHKGFWWDCQKERDHQESPDVVRQIILKLVLEMWDGVVWTGLIWPRIRDLWQVPVTTVMSFRFP
jgi:hypothetical protein